MQHNVILLEVKAFPRCGLWCMLRKVNMTAGNDSDWLYVVQWRLSRYEEAETFVSGFALFFFGVSSSYSASNKKPGTQTTLQEHCQ